MRRTGDKGLWRAPHLPLFLLAAVWAALVPLVWVFADLSDDPVGWHRQELILGFGGAAMGGYLLSALPHWLKQAGRGVRVPGKLAVQGLVLAWVIGRLAAAQPRDDALILAGVALYPLGLCACLLVPVLRARAWRRVPIALAPLALLAAGLALRMTGDGLAAALLLALLVAVVGGRIVPAFLAARAGHPLPGRRAALPLAGRLADLMLALALAAHLGGMADGMAGGLLVAAAAAQAARVWGWPLGDGLAGGQDDLAMLVLAWLWLPTGLLLAGVLRLVPAAADFMAPATALHALTMGLMGGMILAVMARASMRRVPGALQAGNWHRVAFALVMLATLLRLALAGLPGALAFPAALWCLGWAIFSATALRAVSQPVPHPVLSAARPR